MKTEKEKMVFYTTKNVVEELEKIAKKQNRTRGNLIETIIKEYLDKI